MTGLEYMQKVAATRYIKYLKSLKEEEIPKAIERMSSKLFRDSNIIKKPDVSEGIHFNAPQNVLESLVKRPPLGYTSEEYNNILIDTFNKAVRRNRDLVQANYLKKRIPSPKEEYNRRLEDAFFKRMLNLSRAYRKAYEKIRKVDESIMKDERKAHQEHLNLLKERIKQLGNGQKSTSGAGAFKMRQLYGIGGGLFAAGIGSGYGLSRLSNKNKKNQ